MAFALYVLRNCKIHGRYQRRATGPVPDVEKDIGWAVPTVDRVSKYKYQKIVDDPLYRPIHCRDAWMTEVLRNCKVIESVQVQVFTQAQTEVAVD